jgi:hypothetical protein
MTGAGHLPVYVNWVFDGTVPKVERLRVKWVLPSEEDREAVTAALEKILLSPQFRNSKRYPDFLRCMVDQVLNGNIDQIKERTVGIEVFGRAPDYDTNTDTVVRYTAGEVRKRLSLYYTSAAYDPIQIILSPRSYHPEFYRRVEDSQALELVPLPDLDNRHASVQPAHINGEESGLTVCVNRLRKKSSISCLQTNQIPKMT